MGVRDAATAQGTKQQATGATPHVIVMFGATGDLARRKLLPGLLHLSCSNLAPEIRVIGTSLDEIDNDAFRKLARKACVEFCRHEISDDQVDEFIGNVTYLPQGACPEALGADGPERGGGLR